MLRFNPLWAYLIMPLLSVLTLFVLPLRLYWHKTLRAKYFYTRVNQLPLANHLLVTGKLGNCEIVALQNLTSKVQQLVPARSEEFVVSFNKSVTCVMI